MRTLDEKVKFRENMFESFLIYCPYIVICVVILTTVSFVFPISWLPGSNEYQEIVSVGVHNVGFLGVHPEYYITYQDEEALRTKSFDPLDTSILIGETNLLIIQHGRIAVNIWGDQRPGDITYVLQLTKSTMEALNK